MTLEAELTAARAELLARLGVRFTDPGLFDQALRHASYVRDRGESRLTDNERLEFLGDAVLELAVGEYLLRRRPASSEGELTTLRSRLVRATALARVAESLGVREAMLVGGSAETRVSGLRRISSSAVEALVGAVFLDQGWEAARQCVLHILRAELEALDDARHRNYKSELQELTQERHHRLPEYRVLRTAGPDHERRFEVEVLLDGVVIGRGAGASKKEASQAAAAEAMASLTGESGKTSPR